MDTSHYIENVMKSSQSVFVYIVILLFAFFAIVGSQDVKTRFVVVCFTIVCIVFYYHRTYETFSKVDTIHKKFNSAISRFKGNLQLVLQNVYSLHKEPKSMKYLQQRNDALEIINDIAFVQKYDNAAFESIVVTFEYFYRIYFKILTDAYDVTQWYQTLHDVRRELLSNVANLYMNTPLFSSHTSDNVYGRIQKTLSKLTAFTYECMRIIARKHPFMHYKLKPPYPMDKTYSKHLMY